MSDGVERDAGARISSGAVSYELTGVVAVVRIDDGKANALTPELIGEVNAALDRAEREAHAVVVTGRPGRFSAGFDLAIMRQGGDATLGLTASGGELACRLFGFPRPVVLACTGHAIAMGAVLLCSGDVRLGADGDFKIGLNETANGMTLPVFALELARERLAPEHLTRATLMAEIYDPKGAVAAGFLDSVVAPDAIETAALATAARLAKIPSAAFAGSKLRLRGAVIDFVRRTLPEDMRRFARGE